MTTIKLMQDMIFSAGVGADYVLYGVIEDTILIDYPNFGIHYTYMNNNLDFKKI